MPFTRERMWCHYHRTTPAESCWASTQTPLQPSGGTQIKRFCFTSRLNLPNFSYCSPSTPPPLFQAQLSHRTQSNVLKKSKYIISPCFSQTWSSVAESLTGSHKTLVVSTSYVTVFYSHYSLLPKSAFPYFAWNGSQANTPSLVHPYFSHLKRMVVLSSPPASQCPKKYWKSLMCWGYKLLSENVYL